MYLLGFVTAVGSAWALNKVLKVKSRSFFVVEMPNYKLPLLKNVVITVIEKTKSFVFVACKIILAISIILWFLATNGPSDTFGNAEVNVTSQIENQNLSEDELATAINSYKLGNSSIGIAGHAIEPAITPRAGDGKTGI